MESGRGKPSPIKLDLPKSSSSDVGSALNSAASRSVRIPKTPKTPASATSSRSAKSTSSTKSGLSGVGSLEESEGDSSKGEDEADGRGQSETRKRRMEVRTERTWKHQVVRVAAIYTVLLILLAIVSLLLTLTRLLIEPLYNSLPLSLHPVPIYAAYTIIPALVYRRITIYRSAQDVISARICLSIAAIGGDLVSVFGRHVGSLTGRALGAEWGAIAALALLGVSTVGGANAFALLCFDHILPNRPTTEPADKGKHLVQILLGSVIVVAHIWASEQAWRWYLCVNTSALVQHPEKSILFISILLTAFSLVLRSARPKTSLARCVHSTFVNRFKPDPKVSKQLWDILSHLPGTFFPLLLLLRIPLLLLAVRQQLFLHPHPPYLAATGTLRLLHSERGITGRIVVAENVQAGYRFLRCDASILGGRWVRERQDGKGGIVTDMGDSIFGTFTLQEVALLARRNDESDSLARTLALTTGLQLAQESSIREIEVPERALIIGLGVGIAAQAFSQRSLEVDMVEIDPVVYQSANRFFNLHLPTTSTINLVDGAEYVRSMAKMVASGDIESPKWRIAVQDCFTGGMVPSELFTREFWEDLRDLVAEDGMVAMNFVGLYKSKASRAVLVTLLSVFNQCRAFGDATEAKLAENDSVNMVVLCTMTYSPLLTFRRPTPSDVLRSPLRSHVYSTFLSNEIQLDGIVRPEDWEDPELMLRRGDQKLDAWQVKTALDTWKAMQRILTPEMWLAY